MLPFLAMRGIYATLTVFLPPSAFKTSLAARIIMSIVPEMIVVVGLVAMGIHTRMIETSKRVRRIEIFRYPSYDSK